MPPPALITRLPRLGAGCVRLCPVLVAGCVRRRGVGCASASPPMQLSSAGAAGQGLERRVQASRPVAAVRVLLRHLVCAGRRSGGALVSPVVRAGAVAWLLALRVRLPAALRCPRLPDPLCRRAWCLLPRVAASSYNPSSPFGGWLRAPSPCGRRSMAYAGGELAARPRRLSTQLPSVGAAG